MIRHLSILLAAFLLQVFSLAPTAYGQPSSRVEHNGIGHRDPRFTVVTEKVSYGLEAQKRGIRKGDILLNWYQGDHSGPIQSPFDLLWLEIEQKPRGTVRIEGLRGGQEEMWVLGPGNWGLWGRPELTGKWLSVFEQGQSLAKAGKLNQAMTLWRAASIEIREHQPSVAFWLLFYAATTLSDAQKWAEADVAYQTLITESASESRFVASRVLHVWAQTFELRGNLARAEKHYQESLDVFKDGDSESLAVAAVLNDLGVVARKQGNGSKAEEYLRRALSIREKLAASSLDLAWTLNNLGLVAGDRGELDMEQELYLRALAIQEKVAPDGLDVASSLNNLGTIAGERGDSEKADEYFCRVVEITEKLSPRSESLAAALGNLGILAKERGDLAKAEHYYRRVLAMGKKLPSEDLGLAWIFENLAYIAVQRGDLDKAEQLYHQAFAIRHKRAPGSLAVASSLNDFGLVAEQRGHLDKAEEYFLQALDIERKSAPNSPDTFENLLDLADVVRVRGNFSQAEEYYRQALAIQEKLALGNRTAVLEGLGDVARDRGDLDQAEEYYRQSLAAWKGSLPRKLEWARTLASLASVLQRKHQLDSAEDLFGQALNAFESQTDRLGGIDEARARFRARHANYYMDYIDLLVNQKKPELALYILERWRARSLLEILAEAHVDLRTGIDSQLLEMERTLQERLRAKSAYQTELLDHEHSDKQAATMRQEIEGLLDEYHDVEGRIRSSSPAYAALTQPQPLTANQIQQLLDPDTLLLEYALGEERSYVWVVGSTLLTTFELPKQSVIEMAARRVYEILTVRNRMQTSENDVQRMLRSKKEERKFPAESETLSRMILAPVAPLLAHKRLLIVSDGALQYVPFAALPSPTQKPGRDVATAVPLIVDHEIVNLPSASTLDFLRRESAQRNKVPMALAVLADPVFDVRDERVRSAKIAHTVLPNLKVSGRLDMDRSTAEHLLLRSAVEVGAVKRELRFPRLWSSRAEANAITRIAPAGKVMKALDFNANRATAISPQLSRYRIVHFATHGLLNTQHPELSGIVLSLVNERGEAQDGFLTLTDIYNLTLPADMVVLSGCETALGKEIRGEGLVGMTRGFMHAGASRVVASLWQVDDVATADLMGKFYKGMLVDDLPPAAALRKAQIEMWKQKRWNSPYYWAAFVMQGQS